MGMIDDRFEAADSPHLDLDFTMMGNTIVTTIEVDTTLVNDVLATISSVNNGRLMVSTQETASDMTEIAIVEQASFGESQVIYQQALRQSMSGSGRAWVTHPGPPLFYGFEKDKILNKTVVLQGRLEKIEPA